MYKMNANEFAANQVEIHARYLEDRDLVCTERDKVLTHLFEAFNSTSNENLQMHIEEVVEAVAREASGKLHDLYQEKDRTIRMFTELYINQELQGETA